MMKKILIIGFLIWFVISCLIFTYVQLLDFRIIAIGEIQSYTVKADKASVVINSRTEMVKSGYYGSFDDDVVVGSRAIVYSFGEDFYMNKYGNDNIITIFALVKIINFSKFYAVLILFFLFSNFMKKTYGKEIYVM